MNFWDTGTKDNAELGLTLKKLHYLSFHIFLLKLQRKPQSSKFLSFPPELTWALRTFNRHVIEQTENMLIF